METNINLGLNGKIALVTGGTHGIGLAIAKRLGLEGCKIAICSRDSKKINDAFNVLNENNIHCLAIECDMTNKDNIDKMVCTVVDKWEKIDILINNVGGGGRWGEEDILKTDLSVWVDVLYKNFLSTVECTIMCLPYMIRNKWGRVITITSIYGREAGCRPWFNSAKTAQTALMKNLARDKRIVRNNITFNSVAPGDIMISGTGWHKEKENNPNFNEILEDYPMGRMGTPDEVACVVAFISSPLSSYVNGASILVDGGQSRCF